ncbi:UNVERIFIED_CONTAM: hypothetical protein Sindi_0983800 [Sesamum indicum]
MDWVQKMVSDAAGPSYFSSYHKGMSDDGMKSCPTDVGPSSWYNGGPYDYVSGLSDRFYNVVDVADQPLWSDYIQSQLELVAGLVTIKAERNISERTYGQISQWTNNILPSGHTLLRYYHSTKNLIRDLGLPIEKIDAKNNCMLYWKDDVDLGDCKFCEDAR